MNPFLETLLVSMVPVIELRGGIPYGILRGLSPWLTYAAAVIGNNIPVPFIIIFIRKLFAWGRSRFPFCERMVSWLEERGRKKGESVRKYQWWGLVIFVAIPLPGTGAWTGALAAAYLDMRLKKALPAIFLGTLIAGVAVMIMTAGVGALLG